MSEIGPYPRVHFGGDERMLAEMTYRGYCAFASVELNDGSRHRFICWDPVRLEQDIQTEFENGASHFAQRTLIVVESVTRENIEAAVTALASEGFFDRCK